MACGDDEKMACLCTTVILFIIMVILACLYTNPNLPKLSIEEFSVPAFNKTSNQISGDLYFDLKLRNMNKAVGLYYDDPFTLAFSYYPIDEPYQKYVWEYTVPGFYQGNGKTKHVKTLIGNHIRPLSTVVDDEKEEEEEEGIEEVEEESGDGNYRYKHVIRSLLITSHVEPATNSTVVVDGEDGGKELTEMSAAAEVVSFRVDLMFSYRYKLWVDHYTHVLEVGGDVVVDANSGERVTKGSIKLVESAADAAGGPVMVVVLFTSFLLMSM